MGVYVNGNPKDGLYNIKDGKIYKYKSNGGTVRTYDLIEIDLVRCGECKHYNEETHGCNRNPSVNAWWETDFCSYRERANADQHTQSVESALNRETCNLAYYGICTDGDCNKCPYEEIKIDEPKKGKWIDHSDEGYVECPFCGSLTTCEDNIDELHYCFNCGAKMEGSE